jgi:hypothetical protein
MRRGYDIQFGKTTRYSSGFNFTAVINDDDLLPEAYADAHDIERNPKNASGDVERMNEDQLNEAFGQIFDDVEGEEWTVLTRYGEVVLRPFGGMPIRVSRLGDGSF